MSARVLGVDVGSSAVRVAEVEVRPKGRATGVLRAYGSASLAPNVVNAGAVVDPIALGNAIKQAMSSGGARCKDAIVGIGAFSIAVREMALPQMTVAEARRSLPLYVEKVLPMPTDEAVLDFYPTTATEVDGRPAMNGMLVAASTAMVTQVLDATDRAGLDLKAIDLSAFAIYRALSNSETDTRTVAFVDLGARVTTVAVYDHGMPRLVRHLDGGTMSVTDAVASALGITNEEAYNAVHGAVEGGLSKQAADTVRGHADALLDGVRQTIAYYAQSQNAEPVAEVVLTGGGALVPNLPQALASRSRVPVSFGEPLTHVSLQAKMNRSSFEAVRPLYGAAIGLTLRETP